MSVLAPPTVEGVVGEGSGRPLGGLRRVDVRDRESGVVYASARVDADGSFRTSPLPRAARGRAVEVSVVAPLGGQSAVETSEVVVVPASGSAFVALRVPDPTSADGAAIHPARLTPSAFASAAKEHLAAREAFADARAALRDEVGMVEPDRAAAAALVAGFRRPATGVRGLRVATSDTTGFARDSIVIDPSPGVGDLAVVRVARVRSVAAAAEAAAKSDSPLCAIVQSGNTFRGFERRLRLGEQLARYQRRAGIALPRGGGDGGGAGGGGDGGAGGSTRTVQQAEQDVELAVLERAEAAVERIEQRDELRPSTADDLRRLREVVRQLELAGGASNVAAAREVHTLQIAFNHPSQPIVDPHVIDLISILEDLRGRLQRERKLKVAAPPKSPTIAAFHEYLSGFRQTLRVNATEDVPQSVRGRFPTMSAYQWAQLSDDGRDLLLATATGSTPPVTTMASGGPTVRDHRKQGGSWWSNITDAFNDKLSVLGERAESDIDELLEAAPSVIGEAERTIQELLDRLREPYEFDVFPPGSVNYGLLLTWRQEWSPVQYQVGRLVETLPLAPGERREFRVSMTRKVHETRKTVSSQTRESVREATSSRRLEAEAVEASTMAINNQVSANGSFSIGVGSIGGSTQFSQNLTRETRRVHKTFAEMARKATDSLKEQVEVMVEQTTDVTTEMSRTQTLHNPNDERTVTYLLYELERRYRVLTELQSVRPVILVARDMPHPGEIDEAWLLRHSWLIRENLLDTELVDNLDRIEEARSGAALEYEVRRAALIEQRRVTTNLLREHRALERAAQRRRETIVALLQGEGEIEAGEMGTGERVARAVITAGVSELWGGGQSDEDEILEARRKAAEKALEYLEQQISANATALDAAKDALERATDAFAAVAAEYWRYRMAIARLRSHVRDNIFHYMHAIWAAEHPDQRYFALYDDLVPFHTPNPGDYQVATASAGPLDVLPGLGAGATVFDIAIKPPDTTAVPPKRRLCDIADIDRPLGCRGNLEVFELRECSQLTDYMAAEYLDPVSGVREPGSLTGIGYDEFLQYVEMAAEAGVLNATDLAQLVAVAEQLLEEQIDPADEVALPTGQLFMEAITGETTLLEPFKLAHRGLDVVAAEEGVRAARIDALRRLRRVAVSELERDPVKVDHFHLGEVPGVVLEDE